MPEIELKDPSSGGHNFGPDYVCRNCGAIYGSGAIAHGWPGVMVYRIFDPRLSGSIVPVTSCSIEIVRCVLES